MWIIQIIIKLKFKSDILKSSNKSILYNFLFIYIKISKHSSAKYNQENKGRIQNISKEKKEKKTTVWSWTLQKSVGRWKTKAC